MPNPSETIRATGDPIQMSVAPDKIPSAVLEVMSKLFTRDPEVEARWDAYAIQASANFRRQWFSHGVTIASWGRNDTEFPMHFSTNDSAETEPFEMCGVASTVVDDIPPDDARLVDPNGKIVAIFSLAGEPVNA